MLRMEIGMFLVLAFVGAMYFSAQRRHTPLHRTFGLLLITTPVHLILDATTIYTVNHLDTVPILLNDLLHRLFHRFAGAGGVSLLPVHLPAGAGGGRNQAAV